MILKKRVFAYLLLIYKTIIIKISIMKKIIASMLLVCIYNYGSGQTKVNFPGAKVIEENTITIQTKETKTIYKVSIQNLKSGVNYLTLKNGDKIYVEVVKRKVKTFTISKADGTLIGVVKPGNGVLEFNCSENVCSCIGDADCNRMFSTNVCGPVAVCVGNACACYAAYNN